MFLQAATRQGCRRVFHAVSILLAVGCVVAASIALSRLAYIWVDANIPGGADRPAWDWLEYAGYIAAFVGAGTTALLLRDTFLIARVRRVIRSRGLCPICRYNLLGIVIPDGNTVICPECGRGIEADPNLNEITTDDEGRRRFTPSGRHKSVTIWTPRRLRILKRTAIVVGLLLFVVLPLSWGGYELFLRLQAADARADRVGTDTLAAFVQSGQPNDLSPADANIVDILEAAEFKMAEINDRITAKPEHLADDGATQWVDLDALTTESETDTPYGMEPLRRRRALAAELLDAYRETGLLDQLDSAAQARRVEFPIFVSNRPLAITSNFKSLRAIREFARLSNIRIQLAHRDSDLASFSRAAETGLALARATEIQPSLLPNLTSIAIENLILDRLQRTLLQHPGRDWIDATEQAIERQRPDLPAAYPFEAERLYTLDHLAWFFSDPNFTRFGRFSEHVDLFAFAGEGSDGNLGTYRQNLAAYNAAMDTCITRAAVDPSTRSPLPKDITRDLIFLNVFIPAMDRLTESIDRRNAMRRATTLMIALERHYLDTDRYPDSLDALVPAYLPALPLDPWTGTPFSYTPLRPDAHAYSLRAAGHDGLVSTTISGTGNTTHLRADDLIFSPQ